MDILDNQNEWLRTLNINILLYIRQLLCVKKGHLDILSIRSYIYKQKASIE
jgi:hypothetical protein